MLNISEDEQFCQASILLHTYKCLFSATNVYFSDKCLFSETNVYFCTRVSPQRPAWFLRDEVVTGVFTVRNLQEAWCQGY